MRILAVALFVLCVNSGINLAVASFLFQNSFFFDDNIDIEATGEVDFLSDTEQLDVSVRGLQNIINLVKWDWVKTPFLPFVTSGSPELAFLDLFVAVLNGFTALLLFVGLLTFVRNLVTTGI